MTEIDATPLTKSGVTAAGKRMAYHERGEGETVVFLHGNPTSSYLWRNVIPHVAPLARCVAPDLIGMGDSDRLDDTGPGSYRFVDHRRHLDAFLDEVCPDGPITFVVHDWGSALGFDWGNRHRDRVGGFVYMEGFVQPLSWDQWPEAARGIFEGFRSEAGEKMVMDDNVFVEAVLPSSVLRDLAPEEMEEYRRPFRYEADRRPTLTWPREVPLDGEPADVVEIVRSYSEWLADADDVPKLFVNAEPGAILTGPQRELCRSWPNQSEVTVAGIHFIQEDSPHDIGRAIAGWFPRR